jgi:hypothetical protein
VGGVRVVLRSNPNRDRQPRSACRGVDAGPFRKSCSRSPPRPDPECSAGVARAVVFRLPGALAAEYTHHFRRSGSTTSRHVTSRHVTSRHVIPGLAARTSNPPRLRHDLEPLHGRRRRIETPRRPAIVPRRGDARPGSPVDRPNSPVVAAEVNAVDRRPLARDQNDTRTLSSSPARLTEGSVVAFL